MLTKMLDMSHEIQSSMKEISIYPYDIEIVDECSSTITISNKHNLADWLSIGLLCLYTEVIEEEKLGFVEVKEKNHDVNIGNELGITDSPLIDMGPMVDSVYEALLGNAKQPLLGEFFIVSILGELENPKRVEELSNVLCFRDFYDTETAQKAVLQLMRRMYIFNRIAIRTAFFE